MKEKETYEKHGIERVDYSRAGYQLVKCPKDECVNRKKKNIKSLSVHAALGVWKCHHCGWKGGLKDVKEEVEKLVVLPKRHNQTNMSEEMINWFRGRAISVPTLERNKITMEKHWMPQTSKEESCICFNYFRDGKLVNVKYRDGRKNFSQSKGAEKILYKLDDIRTDMTIKDKEGNEIKPWCIITEGEMDALSFEEVGIKNAISVPDGAPNPKSKNLESKFTYIDNCADDIEKMTKIYIAVDTDEPGMLLRNEIARRVGKHICWIIKYPEDCKDANDVLMKHGGDALKKCVEDAEPYPIEDIIMVKDFSDEIDVLYNKGFDKGVTVGFNTSHSDKVKSFDRLITFKTSMFTVITGIPSHGKSNFVEQLAVLLNVFHGWKAGIFSPEHYPMSIMFQRIAKLYTGKSFFKRQDEDRRMTVDELGHAKKHIGDNFFFIRPKDEKFDLETILDAAKGLVLRYGIKLFIIDPWNSISHDRKGMNESDYTEWALNLINDFKQKYDVHVIVVAHPIKMKKKDDGSYHVPSIYSISGSAHWFNKPDNGMVIYRDFDRDEVQVHIQKIKYEHLGSVGMAIFKWNHENSRYYPKGSEPFNLLYSEKKKLPDVQVALPYKDNDDEEDLDFNNISDEDLPF